MGFSIGRGLGVGNKLTPLSGVSAGGGLSFEGFVPPTPAAPVNTVAPTISGAPYSGQTLFCSPGTWTGYPRPTFTYQWKDDGVDIGGATSASFLLTDTQIGGNITCVVTGTNASGSDTGTSNSLGPVGAALVAPVNTVAPVASGTGEVGETLSVTDGTWTGNPTPTYTYQWRRDLVPIGGATANTYLLVNADNGTDVDCVVTGTNLAGSTDADSNDIAVAAFTAPVNTVLPAITGTTTVGSTLSCSTGTWTGNPTPTYAYQWRADGANIGGATSSTFDLTLTQLGALIDCRVTATNVQGSASADANDVGPVTAPSAGNDLQWGSSNTLEWGSGNNLQWGT